MKRKNTLDENQIYHIFSRSIAKYQIFNDDRDYERFMQLIKYFKIEKPPTKFSYFIKLEMVKQNGFNNYLETITNDQANLVQIIAYCLMPTHIHLILKQLEPDGISIFMSKILNSYTRYFNTRHKRKGPLWESKFQNVLVENDEQLLHLTRYIHLNPVTAKIINKPQDWQFSSYREYTNKIAHSVCQFNDLIDIDPIQYKKFVRDQIGYQRELNIIKKQLID